MAANALNQCTHNFTIATRTLVGIVHPPRWCTVAVALQLRRCRYRHHHSGWVLLLVRVVLAENTEAQNHKLLDPPFIKTGGR